MKLRDKHTQLFLCAGLLFAMICMPSLACKQKSETISFHEEYAPLDSGICWVYQVDSISFDNNSGKIDTFHFREKRCVIASLLDQQGKQNWMIQTSKARTDTNIFLVSGNVFAYKGIQTYELVEDNTRTVKLVFPLGDVLTWNGNMQNGIGYQKYSLAWPAISLRILQKDFAQVVIVNEANEKNLIEQNIENKYYAKNVGLVKSESTHLDLQGSSPSGHIKVMQLLSFQKP